MRIKRVSYSEYIHRQLTVNTVKLAALLVIALKWRFEQQAIDSVSFLSVSIGAMDFRMLSDIANL